MLGEKTGNGVQLRALDGLWTWNCFTEEFSAVIPKYGSGSYTNIFASLGYLFMTGTVVILDTLKITYLLWLEYFLRGLMQPWLFCIKFLQVFGSGSVIRNYGSGSGRQFNSYCCATLWLIYDFLPLKNDVNGASKSNRQKHFEKTNFLVAILKVTDENSRIRSRSQRYGSGSVPKYHGPQHCIFPSWIRTKDTGK